MNKILQLRSNEYCRLTKDTFGTVTEQWIREVNTTPRDNFQSTVSVSITASQTTLLTMSARVDGHPANALIASEASENFCNQAWVKATGQNTAIDSEFCATMADGVTTTTTRRIREGELELGDHKSKVTLVLLDLSKFDVILGQPWLAAVNLDIDWMTKTIRDRQTGHPMATADGYTIPLVVYNLSDVDMARTLRQDKQAEAFLVTTCAIDKAIEEISTDQPEEWTTELRTTLHKFEDNIKELDGPTPKREWDLKIKLDSEVPPKSCTY